MPEARISNHRIHYHITDGCVVVRPEGACNESRTEALASFVNSSLAEAQHLILDLSHSKYVETPGFRWIVRKFRDLEASGKTLVVVGLPPAVERTFRLLRLHEIVPVAKDVSEAKRMIYSSDSYKERVAV